MSITEYDEEACPACGAYLFEMCCLSAESVTNDLEM